MLVTTKDSLQLSTSFFSLANFNLWDSYGTQLYGNQFILYSYYGQPA